MLEPTSNDGLVFVLLGLIVLVFTGLGLSLLMDHSSDSAGNLHGIRSDIERQSALIGQLEAQVKSKKLRLSESRIRNSDVKQQLESINARILVMNGRKEQATETIRNLGARIAELEKMHGENLARTRKEIFTKSAGEYLGTLITVDGRTYHHARIQEVGEKGMTINHVHGSVFISSSNLPELFWERYGWHEIQPTKYPAIPKAAAGTTKPEALSTAGIDSIIEAKDAYIKAAEHLALIAADYRALSSMENRSSSRSVPNSLDTWLDRKESLSSELKMAKAAYDKARAELIILSPRDPILHAHRPH